MEQVLVRQNNSVPPPVTFSLKHSVDSKWLTSLQLHTFRFGVRAAMPGFIGKRLCPELVFVKPNFER
jgi:hypothetical protein